MTTLESTTQTYWRHSQFALLGSQMSIQAVGLLASLHHADPTLARVAANARRTSAVVEARGFGRSTVEPMDRRLAGDLGQ